MVETYKNSLQTIKNELFSLEPTKDGFIRESYLQNELQNALELTKNLTMTLTDEANKILQSVQDIVSLPSLHDDQVLQQVDHAKQKINQTIEQVHTFDHQTTSMLIPIEQDIQRMQTYIQDIQSRFQKGSIKVDTYTKETIAPITGSTNNSTIKNNTKDTGFSPTGFDWTVPISGTNWFGTLSEGLVVTHTFYKTTKGYNVIRSKGYRGKVKITNGKPIQRKKKPAGRKRAVNNIYDNPYTESQIKTGNFVKSAEFYSMKGAAHAALKSNLTVASIGLDVYSDTKSNLKEGASKTKISGDILGDIAVGVGTTAVAAGLTIFALPVAAPIALVAATGFAASVGLTYITEGIKWNRDTNKDGEDDSLKDIVKSGFGKSIGTVAGWLK